MNSQKLGVRARVFLGRWAWWAVSSRLMVKGSTSLPWMALSPLSLRTLCIWWSYNGWILNNLYIRGIKLPVELRFHRGYQCFLLCLCSRFRLHFLFGQCLGVVACPDQGPGSLSLNEWNKEWSLSPAVPSWLAKIDKKGPCAALLPGWCKTFPNWIRFLPDWLYIWNSIRSGTRKHT